MPYLSLPHLLVAVSLATAPAAPTPSPASKVAAPASEHDRSAAAPTSAASEHDRSAAAPTSATSEHDRSAAARAHYAARRYREAAQIYEQLHRDTKAAKYLFNAGMARAAAEHDGAAIVHWRAYLASAPRVKASERTMLQAEIAAAKKRTRPIQLRIEGPLAPAVLTLRAPDDAPQGPRDPLDLVPAAAIDLSLEAGTWIATLVRPGRPDAVASFQVAPDAPPVVTLTAGIPPSPHPPALEPAPVVELPVVSNEPATLTLRFGPRRASARGIDLTLDGPESTRRRVYDAAISVQVPAGGWVVGASTPDRVPTTTSVQLGPGDTTRVQLQLPLSRIGKARLGLGIGLGGAGLVFATAGTVLAGKAPRRLVCADRATCSASADAVLDRSIGLALIGTGLGAVVPALTAGLPVDRSPRIIDKALMIEAGIGGALLVGGLAWYVSEATRTTALDHIPRENAAAIVLGLGGGMLGASAVALVVRHFTHRRGAPVALAPTVTPHTRGLALQAHF